MSDSENIDTEDFAELTEFQRDLLIVIAGNEGETGMTIMGELESYYDESINHGRLYPNLDSLTEKGFLDKFAINQRSNGYELTEWGRNHLRHRFEWEQRKSANLGITEPSAGSDDAGTASCESKEQTEPGESGDKPAKISDIISSDDDLLKSFEGLPVDERCHKNIPVKVVEINESEQYKDADLLIRDSTEATANFHVWTKHDCKFNWVEENWYILSEIRLNEWERKGETIRSLSSTKDTVIISIEEVSLNRSEDGDTETESQNRSEDSDGILRAIRQEFKIDSVDSE